MSFTIQHQRFKTLNIMIASALFAALYVMDANLLARLFGLAAALVAALLPDALVPTNIVIEDGIMKLRHLIGEREISLGSITSMRYTRSRSEGKEMGDGFASSYRARLDIEISVSGKKMLVRLNDNATIPKSRGAFGYFLYLMGIFYVIPDEEVALYRLYLYLLEKTGI